MTNPKERVPLWLAAARILLPAALAGCIVFIFSNSMQASAGSNAASGRVLTLVQAALTRLGLPELAAAVSMHPIRKLAHFCEFALEGFLLMLCLRVYTRHFVRHLAWPALAGLLTALTDETIQRYIPGRSSQVTDVWLDFAGVLTGLLAGLLLLAVCRMCVLLYQHRNEERAK